jgi:hypothetical protein
MRACFLRQNVCALGYGVATLQTPPLQDEDSGQPQDTAGKRDLRPALRARPGASAQPQRAENPDICNK